MRFEEIPGPDQTNREAVTREGPPADNLVPKPACYLRRLARTGPSATMTTVDSGRHGAQRSEVKDEAEGRGTRTALRAMPA